jgi:hypothetical protein
MGMPKQLLSAKRPKRSAPRPLAECLPRINVNDLKIPKGIYAVTAPWISLRYPFISGAKLSARVVEFAYGGRIQSVRLKWIKTGYGLPRFAFICQCGRPVISLYFHRGNLSCRRCCNAIYTSQKYDQTGRKRLAACKLRLELGGFPSINEALPKKAKWKHRKRYQRLRNRVERLEAEIRSYRFQKAIDTRVFAYGVP